jgi:hypothetical protein
MEVFQSQWENFEIATQFCEKDDTIRVAFLLIVIGKECYKIYQHLDISDDDRKKTSSILAGMRKHFEPQFNVIYESYIFNTTEQKDGESIHQYVTRLRQLAYSCEFRTLTEDMTRDRIVLGIQKKSTRTVLPRKPNLYLKMLSPCAERVK